MKNRNPVLVAIFSLITLGIYMLYWLVVTKNEMNKKEAKIPTIWLVFAPLLALITIALMQIAVRFVAPDSGSILITITNIFSILVGIVSVIAIIPASIYWFFKYCKGVELVTSGTTSFNFSFWIGILLNLFSVAFIWAGIMQNEFNKINGDRDLIPDTPYPKS